MKIRAAMSVVVSVIFVVLSGCGVALTQEEIQNNGTRKFDAPSAKVFEAAKQALKSEGYGIAVENPEKGVIKTERKMLGAVATSNGYSATAVEITRQYIVRLTPSKDGGTMAEATPRIFRGNADISEGSVWVIEGDQGERSLWRRLFKELADAL